jgi:hypothetical protein
MHSLAMITDFETIGFESFYFWIHQLSITPRRRDRYTTR